MMCSWCALRRLAAVLLVPWLVAFAWWLWLGERLRWHAIDREIARLVAAAALDVLWRATTQQSREDDREGG